LTLLTLNGHFASERRLARAFPGPKRHRQRSGGPKLSSSVHYAEPRLHYEISRTRTRPGLELGFHCEARDKDLNRYLLLGFRQNLFEIKDVLGESIEAEMWDKGWTKIYEVYPEGKFTLEYQSDVGGRMAEIITCLHPDLRNDVARAFR